MKATILLSAFVVYSAAATLVLSTEPRTVEASGPAADRAADGPLPFVAVGSRIGTMEVNVGGELRDWAPEPGRLTLLLHFNPGCGECGRVMGSWRALREMQGALEASGLPIDLLASTQLYYDEASEYLATRGLEVDLIEYHYDPEVSGDDLPPEIVRFFSTPQTLLIDGHGAVVRNELGAWQPDQVDSWVESIYAALDSTVEATGAAPAHGAER